VESKLEKEFLSSSSRHVLTDPGSVNGRPSVHLVPIPPAAPKPQGCVCILLHLFQSEIKSYVARTTVPYYCWENSKGHDILIRNYPASLVGMKSIIFMSYNFSRQHFRNCCPYYCLDYFFWCHHDCFNWAFQPYF